MDYEQALTGTQSPLPIQVEVALECLRIVSSQSTAVETAETADSVSEQTLINASRDVLSEFLRQ